MTPNGTFRNGFRSKNTLGDPADSRHLISEFRRLQFNASIKAYLTHDWMDDPLAKEIWYCGSLDLTQGVYLRELQQPHGKGSMASAGSVDEWRRFVNDTVGQGTRVANEVVRSMRDRIWM